MGRTYRKNDRWKKDRRDQNFKKSKKFKKFKNGKFKPSKLNLPKVENELTDTDDSIDS
jgi:hypothetical protein